MYPLQLLTDNVPLATMLATTIQPATVGRGLPSTASLLTVSKMPAPLTRTNGSAAHPTRKVMMRPEEEEVTELDVTLEEHPHQRWKEGRPLVRLLKKNHWEAFRKDFNLIQATRQAYFKMHCPNYDQEDPITPPTPSRRWPPLLATWALKSMKSSRCGLDERISGLLTTW